MSTDNLHVELQRQRPNEPVDDKLAFAAGVRMARAALGWSQRDLAHRVGMTQRSVHRIEQGQCEPRRATLLAIENVLHKAGLDICYEDGGLAVSVSAPLLKRLDDPIAPADVH